MTDPNTLVRRSHPDTSRDAATAVDVTRREAVALEALSRWPGRTAREMEANAKIAGLITADGQIWKRLSGLEAKGLAKRDGTRKCLVCGSKTTVWVTA